MIKIGEYQIERLDKYNLKVSKEVLNKNDKLKLEFLGYYPSMVLAVKSIIKYETENDFIYTSLEDFLDSYEKISKDILDRLSEIL